MTTAPAPNHRASLLSGLRTGGVRSTSTSIPHTAAPGATFNVPRFASHHYGSPFPEEDEDQFADTPQQNVFAAHPSARAMPMTAAVDGPNNRFSAQQLGHRGMNPNSVPFSPAPYNTNSMPQSNQRIQNQALQMQMLQLEMMRIQTIQAQQMQAEMLAQAQRQQHQVQLQSQSRRASLGFNPPATAGPLTNSFDLRSATLSAQMRRANQADQMKSQLSVGGEEQMPMTAALGGKFGSRTTSLNVPGSMPRYATEEYDDAPPPTPGSTTVISGGTSLGNPASNNINASNVIPNPSSKSDSAASWRRGGNNNSVLSGNNRAVSSPSVKISPPGEGLRVSPPLPSAVGANSKFRPQPLRFSGAAAQPMPAVTIDTSDIHDNEDGYSSSSAASNSSPTTPRSSSSNETPLSPREEASKKLYEGLGVGRPVSAVDMPVSLNPVVFHRLVSQPTRQPRGPPSGADELGPKNFATRIRRKAIGGLGMLMDARERREIVEAY